jgi:hypothetical protein
VSLPLLFLGRFRYANQGVMDRTHLRFFTRQSLEETVAECGWRIARIEGHIKRRYRAPYMPTRLIEPFVSKQYFLLAEKA